MRAWLMFAVGCTEYTSQSPITVDTTRDPPGYSTDCALGAHCNPHRIDALPYAASGDTRSSDERLIDRYSCASSDEGGAEVWYAVDLPSGGWLTASVDERDGDGVDVDVHLLREPLPDACLARDDARASARVEAGYTFIVVDTWRSAAGVEYPGPFELEVTFTPETAPTSDTASGCPADMVAIEDFCVDRYESHLAGRDPYQVATLGGVAANAAGAVPQGYISGVVAEDACEAAGKRLCDAEEWLRACEGPAGATYPYGDTYVDGACNEGRSLHPIVELFGAAAAWTHAQLNDPRLNQLADSLAPSGAYAECVTAEGVYDMHGNLHEWIADPAGTFRGGFYVDASINGSGCGYTTTAHSFDYLDYSTGFLCCADAVSP